MSNFHNKTPLREERELVEFASLWLPYDGPEKAEIFVRFGISAAQFHQRLHNTLTNHTHAELRISSELCLHLGEYTKHKTGRGPI